MGPRLPVFRMRSDEAKYMTNLRAEYWRTAGPDPFDLEPGTFYAVGIDTGAVLARVPKLPDATRTRTMLPPTSNPLPPTSRALPGDFREPSLEAGVEAGGSDNGSRLEAGPEAGMEAHIRELLRQGKSPGAIARDLSGGRGGRAWQDAHEQVLQVIRRALDSDA